MLLNATDEARARKTAWWVLGALFVFRLLYVWPFISQFNLVGDESYYWDWGRNLDWGYFSKPPMIGWLMGVVGRVGHNSEAAIRIAPLLLGTVSLWLLFKLGEVFYDARTGLLAMLFGALSPANLALNLFFTIDAPLVLCWTASLIVAWRCVEKPESLARWSLLTLVLGVGYLSKQMMLVVPLVLIIFASLTPMHRALLRNKKMWCCIAVSLLFLTPVIVWNYQHNWITFQHTGHHFDSKQNASLLDHAGDFILFPLIQAGLFTPLTWLLMVAVAFGGFSKWRLLDGKERFLVAFCAPGLAVFFMLALRQEIHPNWPAAFYISATVLLAAWFNGRALTMLALPRLRSWRKPALVVAGVVMLLLYAAPFVIGAVGLKGNEKSDVALRMRGWSEVGEAAEKFLYKVPNPKQTFIVAMGHREHASALAFYMPSQPHVFRFDIEGRIESQYEIWPNPETAGFSGWDALVYWPSDEPPPLETLNRAFDNVEKIGEINIAIGKGRRFYQVFLAHKLDHWPKPKPREEPVNAMDEDK